MKICTAALLFLTLAAALGPPTLGSPDNGYWDDEFPVPERRSQWERFHFHSAGVHRPGECCFSYTQRKITCTFMKDYFLTTSACSQPAVIFRTRGGQQVCADPHADGVQECVTKLASKSRLGSRYPVEELQ